MRDSEVACPSEFPAAKEQVCNSQCVFDIIWAAPGPFHWYAIRPERQGLVTTGRQMVQQFAQVSAPDSRTDPPYTEGLRSSLIFREPAAFASPQVVPYQGHEQRDPAPACHQYHKLIATGRPFQTHAFGTLVLGGVKGDCLFLYFFLYHVKATFPTALHSKGAWR
jgi:hypothetical protein